MKKTTNSKTTTKKNPNLNPSKPITIKTELTTINLHSIKNITVLNLVRYDPLIIQVCQPNKPIMLFYLILMTAIQKKKRIDIMLKLETEMRGVEVKCQYSSLGLEQELVEGKVHILILQCLREFSFVKLIYVDRIQIRRALCIIFMEFYFRITFYLVNINNTNYLLFIIFLQLSQGLHA